MEKIQSFKSWWISLTPERRKMAMGAGCFALLLGILYLFLSTGPERKVSAAPEARADLNLLTGSDARTLGLESLAAELKSSQRTQRALEGQLAKLQQDSTTKKDLERLSTELQALTQNIGTLKDDTLKRAAEVEQAKRDATPAPTASNTGKPGTVSSSEAQQHGLFDYPDPQPVSMGPSRPGRPGLADIAPESVKVSVHGESPPPPAADSGAETRKEGELYIPAGSILSGVLITGVDAPTGMQSKRDPVPALMRVKHEAILPNRFRSDVRECFVVFGTTGDLSTERALMRAETLSCIRRDGGVIEASIDAYAMGDDGKAGIRGRLVSRNGSLVAKAALAGFAEALSDIFKPVAIQGFNTSPGQRTQFQAPDSSDALEASGYAGFGGAMRRLSDYFVDLADEIVPFIEIDAARQVEAVMLKGITLKVRSNTA